MTSSVDADTPVVTAAEAARILGVTRGQLLRLAASAPDFPAGERTATGGRVWSRAAIEGWAVTHPDRGPRSAGPEVLPAGRWSGQVNEVASLAAREARALHHHWVGTEHVLLALLHPDCPGAARTVLASFGLTPQLLREAVAASMGDPFEPGQGGTTWSPGALLLLERAALEAVALADGEVASEHVLLALTGVWDERLVAGPLRGIDPLAVRQRVMDSTEGVATPEPPVLAGLVTASDPAPGIALAPTPDGKDPRQRLPWGSKVFVDADGRPLQQGLALAQYFVDRDGNPVLVADGQHPVHVLRDEQGQVLRDGDGQVLVGPVEVPPGCAVVAGREAF
jgi:hypothetical protein